MFGISLKSPSGRKPPTGSLQQPPVEGGVIVNPITPPPLYSWQEREEHLAGPSLLTAPDSQFDQLLDLVPLPGTSNWQDAPDPIRQSNFYADGDKIHPTSRMLTPSKLAIGYLESISNQENTIGKLARKPVTQMFQGRQAPVGQRVNIVEAQQTTYGALAVMAPDGYPY